jgi:hypothetical protein
MAKVSAGNDIKIFQIQKWLGLNESPDGDTGLRMGEAAKMRNFCVTRENHLQIRPGYAPMCELVPGSPARGLWCGYVGGARHLLAACGGKLWDLEEVIDPPVEGGGGIVDDAPARYFEKTAIGEIDDTDVFFFGFSKKVYLLTGQEYYSWDGEGEVQVVEGYVPTVTTSTVPGGGGTLLENLNLLTGKRKQEFSPDGTSTVFHLVEENIDELISVEGTDITRTVDLENGTVTFTAAPAQGTNTITITWRTGNGDRKKITGMRFAELYNGATDRRVFLYGNGTNETRYSDIDGLRMENAEYFPDLNVMAVDSANTPITAMIRHYDRLLVFKTDSAHSAQYGTITSADGRVIPAFYTSPLNREIGCGAPGQVKLVENDPRTVFGRGVYRWTLTVGASRDERNAQRISERVEATLGEFDLTQKLAFDDEERQEYYLVCGTRALVHNYAANVWYYYDHFPALCMERMDGEVYFGTGDGRLMHLSNQYRNDDLVPIDAYWESGAMAFGEDWKRKHSSTLWVSIKPESQAQVYVTAQSNLKSNYVRKLVASGLSSFLNTSFAHWSFGTNRKPQVSRVRLKIKKFTYYTLIFESKSASATATVLGVDMQVRYTGNVK